MLTFVFCGIPGFPYTHNCLVNSGIETVAGVAGGRIPGSKEEYNQYSHGVLNMNQDEGNGGIKQ